MPTASLALPAHQAWMSQGRPGDPPSSGRPAARGLSSGGHSPLGNLTMRNRSMSRHTMLYAVIFLCLSIAAAPLVLLALLFF
jgi:hypothetical protein